MKRYSIMVTEYGSSTEVELCQVDANPENVVAGVRQKTLMVYGHSNNKRSQIRKYNNVRIVDTRIV